MKQKFISLITVVLGLLWACAALAQVTPDVSVLVSQQLRPDGTAFYQYKVINNSSLAIVGLAVGSDYYHGTSELPVYPLGWSFDSGIPAESVTSPIGWSANVITTEESPLVELEWRNGGVSDIQPNQVATGFGVVVPAPNTLYLNSHWTVFFADATAASSTLIVNGDPRIAAKIIASRQQSPSQWVISLEITNNGSGTAQNINLTRITFRTLAGTGTVSMVSPTLPAAIGDLDAGAKARLDLALTVPGSVKKFSIIENGTLGRVSGGNFAFSSAQVMYPKN